MNRPSSEDERRPVAGPRPIPAAGQTIDPLPVVRLFTPDAHATWLLAASRPRWRYGPRLIDLGISMPGWER